MKLCRRQLKIISEFYISKLLMKLSLLHFYTGFSPKEFNLLCQSLDITPEMRPKDAPFYYRKEKLYGNSFIINLSWFWKLIFFTGAHLRLVDQLILVLMRLRSKLNTLASDSTYLNHLSATYLYRGSIICISGLVKYQYGHQILFYSTISQAILKKISQN